MGHYFKTLKKSLDNPLLSEEGYHALAADTFFFLQVLRVKLDSKDKSLHEEAAREIKELKRILETREAKFL